MTVSVLRLLPTHLFLGVALEKSAPELFNVK